MSTSINCDFIKTLQVIAENPKKHFEPIEKFRSTGLNLVYAVSGVAFSIFSLFAAKNRAPAAIPIFIAGGWMIYDALPKKVITREYTSEKACINECVKNLEDAATRKRGAIYGALHNASMHTLDELEKNITHVSQVFEYEIDSNSWQGKAIAQNPIQQSDYQTLKDTARAIVDYKGEVSKIEGIVKKFKQLQETAQIFLKGKNIESSTNFNYVAYGLIDDKAIIHLA